MAKNPAINDASGSLGKALAVLRCFVDRQEQWGVKELAIALDLPGSTVHRFLKILCAEGYLVFDRDIQKYKVGMELYRISSVLSRRIRIRELAQRFMQDIVEQTGESCWLALFDPATASAVYVDELEGPQPFRYSAPIGKREDMTRSAAGLAILAYLPSTERAELQTGNTHAESATTLVRSRGYAMLPLPPQTPGYMLAAPIFDARERPIGCLGIGISELRPARLGVDAAASALADATRRLSRSLGSQLLGGGAAGTWHLGMGVIADLVNERTSDIGLNAAWGAGNRNLDDLERGMAGYCMAASASLDAAYEGRQPFERPHTRLRGMFSLFPLHLHIVARKGVNARHIRDLRGLRISPAERGFTTAFVFDRLFRKAIGHQGERPPVEYIHLDYAEANRQLRDGQVDVVVSLTGVPNPPYVDLADNPGIDLVEVEDDLAEAFIKEDRSYSKGVIGKGSYPGVDHDVQTLMVPTVMCTVAERPEQEVYAITKAVYERRSQLVLAAPAYRDFTSGYALSGWSAPIHPGAARFWREIGVLKNGK